MECGSLVAAIQKSNFVVYGYDCFKKSDIHLRQNSMKHRQAVNKEILNVSYWTE